MLRRSLALLAPLLLAGTSAGLADALGPRFFTDADGRTLSAVITGLDETTVTVRRTDDGKEFVLPLARLSTPDQQDLAARRTEILERLIPLPETAFTRALRADFVMPDARGTAIRPPPDTAWRRAKIFIVLFGVPEDLRLARLAGEPWAKAADDESLGLLCIGPLGGGTSPTPEFDRRLARELPPGFAVISDRALRRDLAAAQAEFDLITAEQSPGQPSLFLDSWPRRTREEKLRWRDRVLGRLPAYWPACGAVHWLNLLDETAQMQTYVCDREGRPLDPAGLSARRFRTTILPFPARPAGDPATAAGATATAVAPSAPNAIASPFSTPSPPAPADAEEHTFRDARGRELRAKVLGVTPGTVRVRRIADGVEMLLGLATLTPADQAFVAALRRDPRYMPAASAVPLPARAVTGAETAKAARFAPDVFFPSDTTNPRVDRWTGRPRLTVRADNPALEEAVRALYEEFCAAAGLTGAPAEGREIVFCLGSPGHVDEQRRALDPDLEPVRGWRRRFWRDSDHAYTTARAYLVVVDPDQPGGRRLILERMGEAFGAVGRSQEFRASAFHSDSKAEQLDEIDQRLLRVVYRKVPAGASREQLVRLVNRHWADPDAVTETPASKNK